ncbi:uncharacterized protein LOC127253569 [Andrographis paniculata]|uniref:uncharacterized protein LOC127253569 n=1 Tax=Andrographis paniculata TaxID=175694 RepID=UPI0021E9261C|nr:uncharacterized protein LOC127253569 [Andrographis paniculata]
MIKEWLTIAMDKEIQGSVNYAKSAAEIWSDLQQRFGKESAPHAYELKQSISSTRHEGMAVSAYYTKLRRLWDEIQSFLPTPKCTCTGCTCGIGKSFKELSEREQLYEFLLGLDNELFVIRTQILAMKLTQSLENAYHLVAEHEQQRSITSGKRSAHEGVAFQASIKRSQNTNLKNLDPRTTSTNPSRANMNVDGCSSSNGDNEHAELAASSGSEQISGDFFPETLKSTFQGLIRDLFGMAQAKSSLGSE